jgi:dTDP-4-amino-4,6-dideoxygalactose transaminase
MLAHDVTRAFEESLCAYTGAPYAVAVDSLTSGLLLCLLREDVRGKVIRIPSRTYMSVPCSILQAGGKVEFLPVVGTHLTGAYRLEPTRIVDSALRFTAGMYLPGELQCISFTGPFKHLKLGKGGAILLDDAEDVAWLRRMRFSGRREISYHIDQFDMVGYNFWLLPELAARGLHMMTQFYALDGTPLDNADLCLPYPDLSEHPAYA